MSDGRAPVLRDGLESRSRPRRAAVVGLAAAALVVMASAGCTRSGTAGTTTTAVDRGTADTVAVWGQPAPAGTGVLEAVSCADATHCWAVGRSAVNALTATATTTPPAPVVIDATGDGGVTWTAEQATVAEPTDLSAVDCPDRRHCMAVGNADHGGPILGAVLVTADGGRTWQSVGSPVGSVNLAAVHCLSATACTVVATDGSGFWSASTVDGGQDWQRTGSLPAGFGGVSNLSCPSAADCVTVGYTAGAPGQGAGAVAVTADAGTTWTAATVPAGVGLLHGVSCADDGTCVAVGTASTATTGVAQAASQVLRSDDGGATWTLGDPPAGLGDAFAVSCATGDHCAAVGTVWTVTDPPTPIGGVVVSGDGGTDWKTTTTRYIPVGLAGVDCPVPTACVAAGNDVLARIALSATKAPAGGNGGGSGGSHAGGSGSGSGSGSG
ncbi:MAG TPA: hypothetical protein VHB02_15885 [Acidimicrobiales bacterium]|nr:hypothetical protein [Acidimicrobiales bacterium]